MSQPDALTDYLEAAFQVKKNRPRRTDRLEMQASCSRIHFFLMTVDFLAGAALLAGAAFFAATLRVVPVAGLAAIFSALRLAAFGSTAALNAVPGTNFGIFCAAILIFVPA